VAWVVKEWKPEVLVETERARRSVADELGALEALGVELRADIQRQRQREAPRRGRARLSESPLRDLFRAT
jgi:hypothetical protein